MTYPGLAGVCLAERALPNPLNNGTDAQIGGFYILARIVALRSDRVYLSIRALVVSSRVQAVLQSGGQ